MADTDQEWYEEYVDLVNRFEDCVIFSSDVLTAISKVVDRVADILSRVHRKALKARGVFEELRNNAGEYYGDEDLCETLADVVRKYEKQEVEKHLATELCRLAAHLKDTSYDENGIAATVLDMLKVIIQQYYELGGGALKEMGFNV